jgi:ABC-type antimicrobial peptide transport system permease subunit/AraC-like DNA-binding protein
MKELIDWPWKEMLLAITSLPGVITIILLLTNKYPSSRSLGQFMGGQLLLILVLIFQQTYNLTWLVLITISVSFLLYSQKFFNQNTRINRLHLLPIVLVAITSFLPDIHNYQLAIRILSTLLVFGYLAFSIINVSREGEMRGISWFQNPGSRLIWFRNYFGFNLLLILYFVIAIEALSIVQVTLGILLSFCFVYIQIIKESDFLSPIPLGNKYQKSTLTPDQKFAILNKLDHLLKKEKFYLQDNASLSNLAADLNTTTHHLSQVINETKGITFQKLISQYRMREAKLLLKDPDQDQTTIENIAALVGYNSKSSFNTAFKKYTGLTPTGYRESKDVRPYREEHFPEREKHFFNNILVSSYHVLSPNNFYNMVTNFLKIFYRTLQRNIVFSAINLFGLTIGFSCSILIYLFIADQLSYDKDIPNSDHIYRIAWINENPQTRTPHPMAQAMVQSFAEVEAATSLSPWYGAGLNKQDHLVKYIEKNLIFEEPDFYFADSTFFDVFKLEVIAGDKDALKKPWSLVITDIMAAKYFGDDDPIGKELIVDANPITVSTVVKGMPKNSHFHFQAIISYVSLKTLNPNNPWFTWEDFGHFNYIKVNQEIDKRDLEAKIIDWVIPFLDWNKENIDALKSGAIRFELQPIQDIHLNSHIRWELENNGNILYIYILSGTLVFILLIVAINYVNLTTAKSLERAKEIGIRKTLGAISGMLTIQFYLESLLFCLFAFLLALGLSTTLLNSFNYLTDSTFIIGDIFNISFMAKASIVCFGIAIASGFYPALVLTSFIPTDVLKGKFTTSFKGNRLRSALVVLQFSVSSILIAGSLIILKQIDFMKTKELGFDQEAVISIKIHQSVEYGGIDIDRLKALQIQFNAIPGVKATSAISNLPGEQFNQNPIYLESDPSERVDASELFVDIKMEEVLNLQIIQGRKFDLAHTDDMKGTNFILNESAVKQLNLTDPIGKSIIWETWEKQEGTIIGVVKDFHFKSLHEQIDPLIIKMDVEGINNLIVKLDGQNFKKTLSAMESAYLKIEDELPFEYHFLDQQLAELYGAEERTLNIFSVFAAIALFLSCLGLLGTAMAIMNQKIKEVGIRKIMGASSLQMMGMVMVQFTKLIGVGLLFGLPISYLLSQKWLEEFSYQVTLGVLPFFIAALILLVVAIASVGMVVMKISYTNPADTLRYE